MEPEQKGYRPRDDRQDRDKNYREQDSRHERPSHGSSSQNQGQRNPFAPGSGNGDGESGAYGNSGGRDRYGGFGGGGGGFGGRDRYGGGGGRDRYGNGGDRNGGDRNGGDRNGGDRNGGNRNGGDRNRGDRNGGDRNGNGRGRDQYGGNRRETYGGGNGNAGNRYGGGRGGGGRYDGGGQRERSYSSQGSYDRRSGSVESSHDTGIRKRPWNEDERMELGKCSPPEQDRPRKRQHTDRAEVGPSSSGGGARRGRKPDDQNDEDRPKRDRYAIIRTKPIEAPPKQGTSGERIQLKANYFELLQRPNYEMVMYQVDMDPECKLPATRKYLMYTQRNLFGAYLYDTQNSVYLTHRLPQDMIEVQTEDRENNPFKLTIRFGTIVSMDTRESLQVLNLILRRAMEGLKLQLIGRNLFDPKGLINYNNFHIQLWPGYTTSIRQHEESVLLCAEITSKVMRNETIYDILRHYGRGPGYQKDFNNEVLGLVVLTDYNNKTYKINDVDYSASPSDTFKTKKGPITFVEYYKTRYNINIKDPAQPMLITRSTDRQRRGGEDETISLIPELCRPTGLTDQQRNNFQLMKAIADHTRMDPRKRMTALNKFNQRLQGTADSQDILRKWNLELSRRLIDIDGRKLKNEQILYGDEAKEDTGQSSDWQNAFKNHSMYLSYPLMNWCVIVPHGRMKSQVQNFVQTIIKVSDQIRFNVSEPSTVDVDDRLQSYANGFEQAKNRNPQLVMAFVNNNNADKYASIKKLGCCTYGIPTQVIVQKTLNQKNLMSVATKVAIQLNCKLGGTPWLVPIPTKGLMTVGIDSSRDSKDRNVLWGALVASMDLKSVRKESFFSCVSKHTNQNNFTTQLAVDMTKALTAYKEYHDAYPDKIVLYRDGVGDGQLEYVYQTELAEIKDRLEKMYSENNAVLKFVFVIVSKKVNTRIFGRDERNPQSGTVVDSRITLPERQDFYLISQTVRQGTVSPTAYNVIYDSLRLPADRLQQLTYKQCHLYYNWAGTVRVPAVCQCAHKLSFLVAQFLHQEPMAQLERKLYFL